MINRIKNKIISLWTNRVFRYSFSWSLILSGIIFSFFSMYFLHSEIKAFIPDVIIVFGVFLNPDFNVDIITKSIYYFLVFIASLIFSFLDLKLIKNNVLINGNTFKYILALIITIVVLTYYIFLTYNIISTTFNKIKSNTNNISKIFKCVVSIIEFLILIATLLSMIIEILSH